MENAWYALQNIGFGLKYASLSLLAADAAIGFVVGFVMATFMYLFIMTERSPVHIKEMVRHKDPAHAFTKVSAKNKKGIFTDSFTSFQNEYHQVRTLVFGTVILFLIVVMIAVSRY